MFALELVCGEAELFTQLVDTITDDEDVGRFYIFALLIIEQVSQVNDFRIDEPFLGCNQIIVGEALGSFLTQKLLANMVLGTVTES